MSDPTPPTPQRPVCGIAIRGMYSTIDLAYVLGCHRVTVFRAVRRYGALLHSLQYNRSGNARLSIKDARTLAVLMGRDPARARGRLSASFRTN